MSLTCQQIEEQRLFYGPGDKLVEIIQHVMSCDPCVQKMNDATKEMNAANTARKASVFRDFSGN